MLKKIYFSVVCIALIHINTLTNGITKEEIIYGTSTLQIRLKAHAYKEEDLTDDDVNLLKEFTSTDNQMKVIACTHENYEFIVKKLKEIAPHFFTEIRFYNNKPWILNEKSTKNLPKLSEGKSYGSQIILTVELSEGDIRVIFVKDNKIHAGNVAGGQEDCDITKDENETFLNTAKRELVEEIGLSDVDDQKLKKMGLLSSISKSTFLENVTWQKNSVVYMYHLNVSETKEWLSKINVNNVFNNPIHAHKVLNNDEIEWIFFVKPELFLNKTLELPLENNSIVQVVAHNADMVALVLRAVFNKEVFIGRNVDYVDGSIEYNGFHIEFNDTKQQSSNLEISP